MTSWRPGCRNESNKSKIPSVKRLYDKKKKTKKEAEGLVVGVFICNCRCKRYVNIRLIVRRINVIVALEIFAHIPAR
jgi:hypothetical protein